MCASTNMHLFHTLTRIYWRILSAFARLLPWRLPLLPMLSDGTSKEDAPVNTHTSVDAQLLQSTARRKKQKQPLSSLSTEVAVSPSSETIISV